MNKIIDICKFIILAFLLTFIMGIPSLFIGFYQGLYDAGTGINLSVLETNQFLMIVELMGGIMLPLFLLATYKQNKQELDIVMPFSKEKRLSKYILGYTLGLLLLLTIWSISVYFSGFQITMVWSMSNFRLLILFFLGYGFQGMAEEIVCRGYLQGRLMKITQKRVAIIISALFFSFMHATNDGITLMALISLFLFGIFTGIIRSYTNDLWAVGAFHSAWNFMQGPVLGVSVSGNSNQALILESKDTPNKVFFNGGLFGLEGSGLTVIIFVIVITLVLFIGEKRRKYK